MASAAQELPNETEIRLSELEDREGEVTEQLEHMEARHFEALRGFPTLDHRLKASDERLAKLEGPGEQRVGQVAFNTLLHVSPALAEEIRGGPDDPFHDDSRIRAFHRAILTAKEGPGAQAEGDRCQLTERERIRYRQLADMLEKDISPGTTWALGVIERLMSSADREALR